MSVRGRCYREGCDQAWWPYKSASQTCFEVAEGVGRGRRSKTATRASVGICQDLQLVGDANPAGISRLWALGRFRLDGRSARSRRRAMVGWSRWIASATPTDCSQGPVVSTRRDAWRPASRRDASDTGTRRGLGQARTTPELGADREPATVAGFWTPDRPDRGPDAEMLCQRQSLLVSRSRRFQLSFTYTGSPAVEQLTAGVPGDRRATPWHKWPTGSTSAQAHHKAPPARAAISGVHPSGPPRRPRIWTPWPAANHANAGPV